MKKVLILSCSTGQGHNSCAQAMMDYYKKQNVECEIQDSLDFIGKRISRFLSWGHSFVYCHLPWLFRWGYRQSEKHPAVFKEGSLVYKALTSGADHMNQYITEGNYTTVICTHIFSAMTYCKMMKRISKEMSEDMEVFIICGTNKRLFKRLGRRYKRKPQIHVIGYRNVFKQFPVNLYG